jgi:prohibitin 2
MTFVEPATTSTTLTAYQRDSRLASDKMSNPQEAWQKLQRMAMQGGRGGGPSPRGLGGAVGGLFVLGGLAVVANNSLFNVDGGHRAIKYTRIGGVSKEIYSEGMEAIPGRRTAFDGD